MIPFFPHVSLWYTGMSTLTYCKLQVSHALFLAHTVQTLSPWILCKFDHDDFHSSYWYRDTTQDSNSWLEKNSSSISNLMMLLMIMWLSFSLLFCTCSQNLSVVKLKWNWILHKSTMETDTRPAPLLFWLEAFLTYAPHSNQCHNSLVWQLQHVPNSLNPVIQLNEMLWHLPLTLHCWRDVLRYLLPTFHNLASSHQCHCFLQYQMDL